MAPRPWPRTIRGRPVKNMGDHAAPFDQKDETAVRLLRIAGARRAVPGDRAARVRAAVHAEWRAATKRRVDQRRVLATAAFLAAAATVVFAVGRLVILEQPAAPISLVALVATIDQLEGLPRRLLDPDSVTDSAIRLGDSIRVGEWIVTDERARVGLRFRDGTSVRLDVLSRARLLSAGMIELVAGAVYVDTERESGRFEVRTPLATARDLGTQFEVTSRRRGAPTESPQWPRRIDGWRATRVGKRRHGSDVFGGWSHQSSVCAARLGLGVDDEDISGRGNRRPGACDVPRSSGT